MATQQRQEVELVKRLALTGITFAQGGDFASARMAVDLTARLVTALGCSGRNLQDYLYGVLLQGFSSDAMQECSPIRALSDRVPWMLSIRPPIESVDRSFANFCDQEDFRGDDVPSLTKSAKLVRGRILGNGKKVPGWSKPMQFTDLNLERWINCHR